MDLLEGCTATVAREYIESRYNISSPWILKANNQISGNRELELGAELRRLMEESEGFDHRH